MTEKNASGLAGLLIGLTAGAIFGLLTQSITTPLMDGAKVFQRENKPAAMRIYNVGHDGIYVATEKEGMYTPLDKYLESIKDKAERGIEEAEIRKAVGWYK